MVIAGAGTRVSAGTVGGPQLPDLTDIFGILDTAFVTISESEGGNRVIDDVGQRLCDSVLVGFGERLKILP